MTTDTSLAQRPALDAGYLESVEFTQFLTDVTTAAGLLEHGKRDKGLARRIGDGSVKARLAWAQKKEAA